MTGQRTGRRDHDSGTPRELGCLQTWKGEVKTMYGSTNSEGGSTKMRAEEQNVSGEVGDYPPLRAERVLRLPGARGRAGVGLELAR